MSKYTSWWYEVWTGVTDVIAAIRWDWILAKFRKSGRGYGLTVEDDEKLKEILAGGYYLILTNRKAHLSTYGIAILTLIKTGKWPDYSHILMNLDLVTNPEDFDSFKLMEATGQGVHYSHFDEVFNCDSVCILEPINMKTSDWTSVMKGLALQLGKKYDNVFDLTDDTHVSCVEMVLDSLRANPDYLNDFPNLEEMIQKVGNLTPQMYRDCLDFKIVFEMKR